MTLKKGIAMHAIRHHLVLLAGLVLLAFLAGLVPTVWVAAVIVVSVGVNRLTSVVAFVDRRRSLPAALPLITALTILSVILAAAGAVFLFLGFSWKPALGFVVLLVAYLATREDEFTASRRKVSAVRAALVELIGARAVGSITEEQLTTRADIILQRDLPRHAYIIDSISAVLVSPDGLTPAQHWRLLELLQRHLAAAGVHARMSELHRAVRAALGQA